MEVESPDLVPDAPTLKQSVMLRAAGGPDRTTFQNWVRRAPPPLRLSLNQVDGRRRYTFIDALRVATAAELVEVIGVPIGVVDPVADDVEARARAILAEEEALPGTSVPIGDGRKAPVSKIRVYRIKGDRLVPVFGAACPEMLTRRDLDALGSALIWLRIDDIIVRTAERLGWHLRNDLMGADALRARAAELEAHLTTNACIAEDEEAEDAGRPAALAEKV